MVSVVKEFACKPIPFANQDLVKNSEFKLVPKRFTEIPSNTSVFVLPVFSPSISEVRKPGTGRRKCGDIMQKMVIQSG